MPAQRPLPVLLTLLCTVAAAFAAPAQDPATPPPAEQPPFHIELRVIDAQGRPVAGAGLAAITGDEAALDATRTRRDPVARSAADGRLVARIAQSPGAATHFLLSAPGKACVRLSPSFDKKSVAGVEVLAADFGNVTLVAGADIRCLVRNAAGDPLPGARVVATGVLARLLNQSVGARNDVRRETYGVADPRGIVELCGVPVFGATAVVLAEGYYPLHIGYLNRHQPVVATMPRGGTLAGRVVGPDDQPVTAASVYVQSEHAAGRQAVSVADDGQFRGQVPGPGRYRLYFYGRIGTSNRYLHNWSEVLRGPQTDLLLRLGTGDGKPVRPARANGAAGARAGRPAPAAAVRRRQLVVKITDHKTGIAVREARAAVMWWPPENWQHNRGYLERHLRGVQPQKTDEQGRLELAPPGEGQPATGRVLVRAEGYAPLLLRDVEWDEEARENLLEARLEPAASLAGVVVDERGQPVAGAKVFVVDDPLVLRNYVPPPMRRRFDGMDAVVVTGAKGEFEVGGLAKGEHFVYLTHPAHADRDPIAIELQPGQARQGVRLELPRGGTLLGKLVGVQPRIGWQVRIQRRDPGRRFGSYYSLNRFQASEFVDVADDGSFRIPGLCRDNYDLFLVMGGAAEPLEIPMEPIRMRTRGLQRSFDVSEDLPGRLTGQVTLRGAHLPPGRLLLLARPAGVDQQTFYSGRPNLFGQPVAVDAQGRFEAALTEGEYVLSLVDLATAVELYRGPRRVRIKPTATQRHDITAELAAVTVRLVPAVAGGSAVVNRVEVKVEHPVPAGLQWRAGHDSGQDTGVGAPVRYGESEVRLVLPCVPAKVLARSEAHNLDPNLHAHNFPALGEVEFTPQTGTSNRVELPVTEPALDTGGKGR